MTRRTAPTQATDPNTPPDVARDTLPASGPEHPPCLCGCGGFPKGKKARFLPGHDTRYHAAQKKAAAE